MSSCRAISSRVVLVIAWAALVILGGCDKFNRAPAATTGSAPPPAPVMVGVAQARDVPVELRPIASVEPFATVTVRSRVSGQMQKIHVTPGQDIKAGDLLFEIDPRPFEIALHEAEARLDRDIALAKNAQVDADRMAGLRKNNVATQEEADKMQFAAEAAKATVRADEAAIEHEKLQIDYSKIHSPVNGRAGSYLADVGNVIKEDDTDLLIINQIQPIYVSFALPEQDLARVKQHMQPTAPMVDVIIPPDTAARETGQLSFIDNKVDSTTGTIRMRATFANEDRRLWPGQFVQATLKLTIEKDATVVPTRAVQTGQQGKFVFVVRDDLTAELRPVTIRREIGDDSVIDSGLAPGERVVLDGHLRVVPGAKVSIKDPSTTAPSAATASLATP